MLSMVVDRLMSLASIVFDSLVVDFLPATVVPSESVRLTSAMVPNMENQYLCEQAQ